MRRLEQLKLSFVKAEMSVVGTEFRFQNVRSLVAIGGQSDIQHRPNVANDPSWSSAGPKLRICGKARPLYPRQPRYVVALARGSRCYSAT